MLLTGRSYAVWALRLVLERRLVLGRSEGRARRIGQPLLLWRIGRCALSRCEVRAILDLSCD